jgi:hypothetical protein
MDQAVAKATTIRSTHGTPRIGTSAPAGSAADQYEHDPGERDARDLDDGEADRRCDNARARRRAALRQVVTPYTATSPGVTIQLAAGRSLALATSFTTLSWMAGSPRPHASTQPSLIADVPGAGGIPAASTPMSD